MNAIRHDTLEIDVDMLDRLRREGAEVSVLDVREPWERDICAIDGSIGIPLGELPDRMSALPREGTLVLLCHHGARSLRATVWLRGQGFPAAVNLQGGIEAWADRIDKTMARY